ncbi:MAG TPA: patatin-like phospholipase family protein [Candidatus Binatia bacterium]|nr:patatin-like phospholipase family protein [Candidatus Binatia bacterium]
MVRPGGRRRGGSRALGLVLSGGGARGAFQVGVYERLLEDPRFGAGPTVLSGTSAGGINAALIAAGKSPREMLQFWLEIADDPPVTASHAFFADALRMFLRLSVEESLRWLATSRPSRAFVQRLRNHLRPSPGGLVALWVEYLLTARFELVSRFLEGIREPFIADTSPLRARLVDAFGGERVPNRGFRLALNTVDAHTGQVVRYVTAPAPVTRSPDYVVVDAITVDMVLASASIPLLFPPVRIDRHLLWDGGILVNTPLAPVVALGADEIVTVLVTEPTDPYAGPLPHFGRAVERTVDAFLENAYNVDRKLLLERNRVTRLRGGPYREVTLYDAVRPMRDDCFNAGSYLYFERSVLEAMHRAGRVAATSWLAAGPRIDDLDEPAAGLAAPIA